MRYVYYITLFIILSQVFQNHYRKALLIPTFLSVLSSTSFTISTHDRDSPVFGCSQAF